jgi:predicted alpha/beta-fold hydrolase
MVGGCLVYVLYKLVRRRVEVEIHRPSQPSPKTQAILRLCQSLRHTSAPYYPTPWIFSGHLDAIVIMKMRPVFDPKYNREELTVDDGTTLLLDWAEPPLPDGQTSIPDDAPLLVLFTGVTGNSKSSYITYLTRECMNRGWRALVMNFPGVFGQKLTAARMWGTEQDVAAVIRHAHNRFPKAPLFAMGFSLGGHLLTKYLGGAGREGSVQAAVVCSSPWSHATMLSSWKGFAKTHVYGKHFIQHFLRIYHNNKDLFVDKVDHLKVTSCKTLMELDKHMYVPLLGLSVDEFYRTNNSVNALPHIQIPLLVVHAWNDPVVPRDAVPVEEIKRNGNATLVLTSAGGHGGWPTGWWPAGLSWAEQLCIEYFEAALNAHTLSLSLD